MVTATYKNSNQVSNHLINEIISYEILWARDGATPGKLTKLFSNNALPSQIINESLIGEDPLKEDIRQYLESKLTDLSINIAPDINGKDHYPVALQDSKAPLKFFYYKGDLSLLDKPNRLISISGSRGASPDGISRTVKLIKELVGHGFTIVSGLAKGVDTAAHTIAIEQGGKTIAVLGTPVNQYYPKENKELQDQIARDHLLISHVPFYKYAKDPFSLRRFYFPQRNKIIASLSDSLVIIEADDKSGTLIQAREAITQGKKLFILDSCFKNPDVTWPNEIIKQAGVFRLSSISDVTKHY